MRCLPGFNVTSWRCALGLFREQSSGQALHCSGGGSGSGGGGGGGGGHVEVPCVHMMEQPVRSQPVRCGPLAPPWAQAKSERLRAGKELEERSAALAKLEKQLAVQRKWVCLGTVPAGVHLPACGLRRMLARAMR